MNRLQFLSLITIILFSTKFFAQNDCRDAIVVCGNLGIKGISAVGPGAVVDYTNGQTCSSYETNSVWFKISVKTSGTLGFTLIPESEDLDVDYDFLVFGPNVNCNNLGNSIRCSTTNPIAAKLHDNHTGMNGEATDEREGPAQRGNGYVKWLTVTAGESYYLIVERAYGEGDFSIDWIGSATLNTPPALNVPSGNGIDLEKPNFNAGPTTSVSFDLTKNTPTIVGSQTNVKVTYHTTSSDAIINANPIANPSDFKNTINPQTVFVRITDPASSCFNWTSFTLKVVGKIIFPNTEIGICDDNDTELNDGKAIFDLNKVTTSIFKDLDISSLNINYYLTKNDAENDQNRLPQYFSNTIAFEQSVFIKAISATLNTEIQEIKLIVNTLPKAINATLIQCGTNPDGLSVFNLNKANNKLTDNNSDIITSFFFNNADAINNVNTLNSNYSNITNPQVLFVRNANIKTGCNSISTLTLIVNTISQTTFTINPVCDDDGIEDGIHLFNLTEANIPLSATQNIKYYSNENDALLDKNQIEIPNSYSNEIPYNQEVYARVEEGNDCYGINKIKIQVNKLPAIQPDTTTSVCENLPSYKAHLDAGIIGSAPINDFSFVWFKDGIEIANEINAQLDVNESGIYTVEVTNKTHCTKTRTFEVTASNAASITSIDIVDFLENDSNKITVNVSGKGEYEYSLDAPNGPFQESNTFSNLNPGFYEVYINDKKNCGTVHQTAAILGASKFFTPNADGYNDYWNIIGLNMTLNKNVTIYIYDRFGKLLKQLHASDAGWDGTFGGNALPADDYWYTIKLEDNREVKGHFSLKR